MEIAMFMHISETIGTLVDETLDLIFGDGFALTLELFLLNPCTAYTSNRCFFLQTQKPYKECRHQEILTFLDEILSLSLTMLT